MKKIILLFLVSFGLLFLFSGIIQAAPVPPLVPCGQDPAVRCEFNDIFKLILNVYNYLIIIATSLAGLGIVIGGVFILISGGPGGSNPITGIASPNMYNKGKTIITGSIFGIVLIWGAWLIIRVVLLTIGADPAAVPQ